MIEEERKELEVRLDDDSAEKEIEVPSNPIEDLVEQAEASEKEESTEEKEEIKVEKKPEVPKYSDDMPYSEKVRKRIAKEVAKRAEAEQRNVELEQRLAEIERKTFEIANKSLKNQYTSVSSDLLKYDKPLSFKRLFISS